MITLFLRKSWSDASVWALPVTAFALTTAIALTVLGGALHLMDFPGELGGFYKILSVLAVLLLLPPMASLMSSAARLMARQRDRRLSTLRLLGATRRQLRSLALAESMGQAVFGVLAGTVLCAVLMPVVGLVHFMGGPLGAGALWPRAGPVAGAVLLILALAAASSLAGLRRLDISPLGVRTRTVPAGVRRMRLAAFVLLLVLSLVGSAAALSGSVGEGAASAVLVLAVVIPLGGVQLLGPLVLKGMAALQVRGARSPETLVAARNVLESPQQMWRQVGGVALSVYLAVAVGAGMAIAARADDAGDPATAMLVTDLRTGSLLTLAISFVMVACSVGIHQTAQLLDRKELYTALHRMGTDRESLARIQRRSVLRSLVGVVVVSVMAAAVTLPPIVGVALLADPVSMLVVALSVATGCGLVHLGAAATGPLLRKILADH